MLVPQHYLDAVGVIEYEEAEAENYAPAATATLLGYEAAHQEADTPVAARGYHVFLATNKHVIEGRSEFYIRFNQGDKSAQFRIGVLDEEDGSHLFEVSDEFDVAVTAIDGQALKAAGAHFSFLPESAFLDLEGLETVGVFGGDGVYVLGFPMGLAGIERKYAVVRGGCVARLDREIVQTDKGFLIDCTVYPGNSGGPVILKPETVSLGKVPPRSRVHVIGIVCSYLPYVETAISAQTLQPRITFQENSGLASVVPMDAVNELVEPIIGRIRQEEEGQEVPTDDTQVLPDDADLLPGELQEPGPSEES